MLRPPRTATSSSSSSRNPLIKVASKTDVSVPALTLNKDSDIDVFYFMLPENHPSSGALSFLRQIFTSSDTGAEPAEVYLSNARRNVDWPRQLDEYSEYHSRSNVNPSWYRDTFHASYEQGDRLRRSNDTDAKAEAFEYQLASPHAQFLKSRIQTYGGIKDDGLCMRFNMISTIRDARQIEKISGTISALNSVDPTTGSATVDVADFDLSFH